MLHKAAPSCACCTVKPTISIYILNIAFTIPLRHLGIFITTIFMMIPPYHLNKHRYPRKTSIAVSSIITIVVGSKSPVTTPRQNASAAAPTALQLKWQLQQFFNISPIPFLNELRLSKAFDIIVYAADINVCIV